MKKKILILPILICLGLPVFADYNSQMQNFQQQRERYYARQQAYQNKVMQNRQYQYRQQEEIRQRNLGLFENEKLRHFGYTGVYYYDY